MANYTGNWTTIYNAGTPTVSTATTTTVDGTTVEIKTTKCSPKASKEPTTMDWTVPRNTKVLTKSQNKKRKCGGVGGPNKIL